MSTDHPHVLLAMKSPFHLCHLSSSEACWERDRERRPAETWGERATRPQWCQQRVTTEIPYARDTALCIATSLRLPHNVQYSSTYYSNVLYCLKPYLSYMQAGGFKLPFLVVGGCIVILMLLLVVLVRPTGTYFPWW